MAPFRLWLPAAPQPIVCTPKELGRQLGFKFISKLVFENKKLLEKAIRDCRYQKITTLSREYGKKYSKQIEAQETIPATIKWINFQIGFGLFNDTDLVKGSFIGEYTGLVRRNDKRDGTNDYLCHYPILDDRERNLVIDGRPRGNHSRFINHSNTPNLKAYTVFDGEIYHIIFIAMQDIPAGSQLSFDYGPSYWKSRDTPLSL